MADEEQQLIADAIAGTEKEIFSDATGFDLPSTEGGPGDRSVEDMGEGLEGQHGGDGTEDTEVEAAGEGGEGTEANGEAEGAGAGEGKEVIPKLVHDPKTGRFTKVAPAVEDEVVAEGVETDQVEGQQGQPAKPAPRVPVGELVNERKAHKATQVERDNLRQQLADQKTKHDSDLTAINRRLDDLMSGRVTQTQQQPAAEQQPEDEVDRLFANPKEFISTLTQTITSDIDQRYSRRYVEADLKRTAEASPDKFKPAYEALTSLDKADPQARETVRQIWNSPTPGADLLKWHTRTEAAKLVGDDIEAYNARIVNETKQSLANDPEFRKQVLEGLQAEARSPSGNGAPRHVARMPKSLNAAAGGQASGGGVGRAAPVDGTDKGVFNAAFEGP